MQQKSVHTIGKTVWKSVVRHETKSVMHFLSGSIIIPNLFTDGAATQRIKTWQGWLAGNIERKQKVILWRYWEKHWTNAERHFLRNTWERSAANSRYVIFDSSHLIHCPSCITVMQMQKRKLLKNINSSKIWINKWINTPSHRTHSSVRFFSPSSHGTDHNSKNKFRRLSNWTSGNSFCIFGAKLHHTL